MFRYEFLLTVGIRSSASEILTGEIQNILHKNTLLVRNSWDTLFMLSNLN